MLDVQWNQRNKRGSAFYHVFGYFKRFYLPLVFPLWNVQDYLYKETEGNVYFCVEYCHLVHYTQGWI